MNTVISTERGAAGFGGTPDPPVVPQRHIGRFVGAFVVLILFALVVLAFARAPIDYATIGKYLFDPLVLNGVVTTMYLTLIAMAIGIVLGIIAALMRQSVNPVLRYVAGLYVWLFRGTPQLVQLLIVFNIALIFPKLGIPGVFELSTNSVMTPLMAAIVALGVNEGSYMSEIVRSGLMSVDVGQTEAAKALGMRRATLMRFVVLPQALRIIVPPTGNELIAMLKITSLAYVISVSELLNSAYVIYTRNYLIIELLFVASIWYLVMTTVLSIGQRFLERRLGRGFGTTRKAMAQSQPVAAKGEQA